MLKNDLGMRRIYIKFVPRIPKTQNGKLSIEHFERLTIENYFLLNVDSGNETEFSFMIQRQSYSH